MEKLIKDGKVAVLISPGFGAGWSTWVHGNQECLFEPEIVEAVLAGKGTAEIERLAEAKYGEGFYTGGASGLEVFWLPVGTQFIVEE